MTAITETQDLRQDGERRTGSLIHARNTMLGSTRINVWINMVLLCLTCKRIWRTEAVNRDVPPTGTYSSQILSSSHPSSQMLFLKSYISPPLPFLQLIFRPRIDSPARKPQKMGNPHPSPFAPLSSLREKSCLPTASES